MKIHAVLFLVLAGLQFAANPCKAQQDSAVLFGVLAFGGEKDAHVRWDRTIEVLSKHLPDQRFRLIPLTLDGAGAALETRGLHFLLTNPGHFQSLMLRYELAPLVSLRTDAPGRAKTGNRYGAVIFARASDDGPKRLSDLRGLRFGAVAPEAFGGWQLASDTLQRNGLEPERDLGELRFFGFPQSAIVEAVLSGEIDAGTVRTGVLEAMAAEGRIPEGTIIVLNPVDIPNFELDLSTALVPEWLIAATPIAQPELRRSVAQVLLGIDLHVKGGRDVGATWLPPQSLASVIEIQRALAQANDKPATLSWQQSVIIGLVGLLSALIVVVSIRRFRPQTSFPPPIVSRSSSDSGQSVIGPTSQLTAREEEVLELVEQGQTTKEIARTLSISPKTVEFHRHNLMQKFDASNMADLVHRAGLWRHS
ncbi:MAG: PhnD/SsuA/transferrin family substrate-binding protein [Rhodobacteraceae bacterium]|nr:PhnD/SsuA/transferrin family substrate-binding protein [Paracoccaceae bacterium]